MESQKDRFIRQFMLIEDDRKERGFDQRSVERKQRVMPQGQIDLSIYPGQPDNSEKDYGVRVSSLQPYEEDSVYSDTFAKEVFLITENQNQKDFSNKFIVVQDSKINFTDCKIGPYDINNTGDSLENLQEVVFEYCSIVGDESLSQPRPFKCRFINCDFSELEEKVVVYAKANGLDKETTEMVLGSFTRIYDESMGNTYQNCHFLDLDSISWA